MLKPGRQFQCAITETGDLRALNTLKRADLAARRGEVVTLREMTAAERRTDRQLRYWFGAIVPVFVEQWERERGKRYSKEEVHAALMVAFGGGPIETPLGMAYPSSGFKSKREFARITNEVREYVWHKYQVNVLSGEDWSRDHAESAA